MKTISKIRRHGSVPVAVLALASLWTSTTVAGTVVGWGDNTYGQTQPPPELTNVYGSVASARATLTVTVAVPLDEALDATNLVWRTGGDAPWRGELMPAPGDVDAARSGAITNHQVSWLETTVTGPGTIQFAWKVSSEYGYDYLESHLGDTLQGGRISGEVDWQQRTVSIPAGDQLLRWVYRKDGSIRQGEDRAWLNKMVFTPSPTPPSISWQPESRTAATGATVEFSVAASGSLPLFYQWLRDGAAVPTATYDSLTLSNLTLGDAGSYAVTVSNAFGSIQSALASLAVVELGPDLADDFDPDIDRLQWSSFGGTVLANNFGGAVSGWNALWLGGEETRLATTRPLDTSLGGILQFQLRLAGGDDYPWERVDLPDEGVVLEYSTDQGGHWAALGAYLNTASGSWSEQVVMIPDAARSPQTLFRWRQLESSGNCCDHWALDDVRITVSPLPPAILVQPQSQTVALGSSALFGVTVLGSAPLEYQWHRNGTPLTDQTNATLVLTNVQAGQMGHYTVAVANSLGSAASQPASLNVVEILPGTLDPAFNSGLDTDGGVWAMLVQDDGKILIGGAFTRVNGQERARLARLNPDGSLDPTFNPAASADRDVFALALEEDDQILIAGSFTVVNGVGRGSIARLQSDGSLDPGFGATGGANNTVWALARQADGTIFIGGDFTEVAGVPRVRVARLNEDGSLDQSFDPGLGMDDRVRALAVSGNQVLAAGNFRFVNGTNCQRVARLNGEGGLDLTFHPGGGPDDWVFAILAEADGKVLVGGNFTSINGVPAPRLARLRGDGSLDADFDPGLGANEAVTALARQSDGKLLVGGGFTQFDTHVRHRIARLRPDGRLDPSFEPKPGANDWIESVALQGDGQVLIGGMFTAVNERASFRVARLYGGDLPPLAPIIASQPVDQTARAGADVTFDVEVLGSPDPLFQWQFHGLDLSGAIQADLVLRSVKPAQAGPYQLVVSNSLGSVTSRVAQLTVSAPVIHPGAVDIDFYAGSGPNAEVVSLVRQSDGRLLIGGSFSAVAGVGRAGVARLHGEGSLDTTFTPELTVQGGIFALALQSDGKVLVAGSLVPAQELVRLHSTGRLDTSFLFGSAADASILAIAVQSDGKIVIGGNFTLIGVTPRGGVARLNSDGSLDPTFDPGIGANGTVQTLAFQGDGKILLGGQFTMVNGSPRQRIARLLSDGRLDPAFDPGSGANGVVSTLASQEDGKILLGGGFSMVNGLPRLRLARLETDGRLDPDFSSGFTLWDQVWALALAADGKVLVGGRFNSVSGLPRRGIARLQSDGSLDTTFDPGLGANDNIADTVRAVLWQDDGRTILAGDFTSFDGLPRRRVVRLFGGESAPSGPVLLIAPTNQVVAAGSAVELVALASGVPPPVYQWQFNGQDLPGAHQWTLRLRNVPVASTGRYRVLVSNVMGNLLSATATLTVLNPPQHAGAPDLGFDTGAGPNDVVHALVMQADQKLLLGGAFTEVNGVTRHHIARLETGGALDSGFAAGLGPNRPVSALAVQNDGKVLIGGSFTEVDGFPRPRLARLHPDGTLDLAFDPRSGVDQTVLAIAALPSGQVLVGGLFNAVNQQLRPGLARFNADGSVDESFNAALYPNTSVYAVQVREDGKILIGGDFIAVGGQERVRVALLLSDGSVDTSFNPGPGPNSSVLSLLAFPDGKALLGGGFSSFGGQNRIKLARLEAGGTLDAKFSPPATADGMVVALASQKDWKTLVGSRPGSLGLARQGIVRLEVDGSVDGTFDTGSGVAGGTSFLDEYGEFVDLSAVLAVAVQADGRIVIGGDFTRVNGMARPYLARLYGRDLDVLFKIGVVERLPSHLELIWDMGTLQEAERLEGGWTEVPGASSPYRFVPEGVQKFFRLKLD